MLRTRLAIAALVTIVAAAGGITAGVVSAHRNAAALDRPATTVRAPATTVTPPTAPTTTIHGAGGTPTTGRTTDVTETTGTPTAPPRVPDPKVAARRLFDAWQEGDRKAALQVASPGAVRALFAVEPTPVPHFSNCRSRNLGFDCQYGYHQDSGLWFIVMRVEGGASAGYQVVSVEVNWRFTSPADAAKDLVDAWRANDRTAAHGASKAAVDAIFRLASRSNPPRPLGCRFGGLQTGFLCDYTGAESGLLVLRVQGGASSGWIVTEVTEVTD